ncbi:MAG: amidohydrolase family protein [Woeseiaceae bacterium]|nr:amidohydrolase family protein [Woeseiaceae bacterium]
MSILLAALLVGCSSESPDSVATQLIVDAVIYDGSGGEPVQADLRFNTTTGRIVEIGDLTGTAGETLIDADGLALAPGFIDLHSHHDSEYSTFRHMPGVLSQGVTTIVRGVDGASEHGAVAEFNALFAASPAAVNIASLSSHNEIRAQVMGGDYRRHATAEEIEAMGALVAADMEAGAIGLSTGLEYEPGIYSSTEEVIELARVAARFGGIYHSHIRDEDDRIFEAVDEVLSIGLEAGLPVHITHIKLADRFFWGLTAELLSRLDAARETGIRATADIYPYERWASNLAVLFPERDYTDRAAGEIALERSATAEDILITHYPANPEFAGMTVEDIASKTNRDVVTTLLELAGEADQHRRETGDDSGVIARSMNEADIVAFMQWPYMSIGSDGWHGDHPRGYGSFPRVLGRFVRERGVISLAGAIHKMTGLNADAIGVADRGRIVVGNFADLVLFDADTIVDNATMRSPTELSTGVDRVWVNGRLAFEGGKSTDTFAGRIVSHSR